MAKKASRREKKDSQEKKKNKRKLTSVIVVISVAVIIALVFVTAYMVDYVNTSPMREVLDTDTIYPNVFVNSVNIGGMKKEDALSVLENDVEGPYEENEMTFVIDGEEYNFNYAQLGVKLNIEEGVERAYNYARDGSIEERYEKYERLKLGVPYSFDVECVDETGELPKETVDNIKKVLEEGLADKAYIEPENGEKGREIDIDRLTDIVVEYVKINQGDGIMIHVPMKEIG